MRENDRNYQFSFEKLRVWQNARHFVLEVYHITEKFPTYEKFSQMDQIIRAAIVAPANIAERSSRLSSRNQAHLINIAYNSLMEVLSHFYLALDLNYVNIEVMENKKSKES